MKKKAAIIIFDRFTDIDLFLPFDMLSRVKHIDKEFEVKILGTKAIHTSSNGVNIETNGHIKEANEADLVYFTSGAGTRSLIKDPSYLETFELRPKGQIICSMCSGSLLLAALGLLDGLSATTYSSVTVVLRSFGIEVLENEHLVVHDQIATAAGCLAAVDLMQWAIGKLYDQETAEAVIASIQPNGKGQKCLY